MRGGAADRFDVAVVGLGVLGSSALRELARRGRRVVGLEQFRLGHTNGSSHGRSRAVRFLYHAPEYVALLKPAIDGWRDLESDAGRRIYHECGTLFFARPGNAAFERSVGIMADGGLAHDRLSVADARRRFPAFAMTEGSAGVFNPDGGMVDGDAALAAFQDGARRNGAEIRQQIRTTALHVGPAGPVRLATDDGREIVADHVVIAGGAWTTDLLPAMGLPIRVTRQNWYTMRPADPAAVGPERVPVWCDYDTMFYGFPDHGPGLKIADDTPGREVVPSEVDRRPDDDERRALTGYLAERFPTSELTFDEAGTCLYTLTPDEDFLLGSVPGSGGRASVVVGLNHAFKFAPVIGSILADLATDGTTPHPIDRFRIDRFASAPAVAG